MHIQEPGFNAGAAGSEAIKQLAQVATAREKTKRLLIGAACTLFCVSALVVVFAPPEKEGLAYVLGAALLVVALGAIGASQFKFKIPGVSVETNNLSLQQAIEAAKESGQIIQHQGMLDPSRKE